MKNNLNNKYKNLSPFQIMSLFYIISISISIFLLSLPFTTKPGVELSFIDALFTAVSAISVTGLTVVSIPDTFNTIGIFILLCIIQVGGIGIMTLATFIWNLLGKSVGLRDRRLIMVEQNQTNLSGLIYLLKHIFYIILFIELVGTIVLGIYYLHYYPNWQEAFYQAFFASISATTNAGFDITGESLIPFKNDYFVQIVTMILIVSGAIGFPVLVEIKHFFISLKNKKRFKFSLFAKVTTTTFFILMILGTILIWILEYNHTFSIMSFKESFFYSLFLSVTTRSAGLTTIDITQFNDYTLLVISIFMFIGASPNSVGGGIRTTTIAIIFLAILSFARGRKSIKVFHREIDPLDVFKSFIVLTVGIFLCSTAVIILSITENFSLINIILEVCSAFGTTGLSTGITPELGLISKIILMILMFIGRIGILTFLFLIKRDTREDDFNYPIEKINIG